MARNRYQSFVWPDEITHLIIDGDNLDIKTSHVVSAEAGLDLIEFTFTTQGGRKKVTVRIPTNDQAIECILNIAKTLDG